MRQTAHLSLVSTPFKVIFFQTALALDFVLPSSQTQTILGILSLDQQQKELQNSIYNLPLLYYSCRESQSIKRQKGKLLLTVLAAHCHLCTNIQTATSAKTICFLCCFQNHL